MRANAAAVPFLPFDNDGASPEAAAATAATSAALAGLLSLGGKDFCDAVSIK